MHRTQIILEDWQHQALQARAAQEGRSMSDLVRELIDKGLQTSSARSALDAVAGIGEDPAAHGRDHDAFLYGAPKKRR
jgi:plasmid stability protein